jgi:hypothetical protein
VENTANPLTSFGFGAPRELLSGLPHFEQIEFVGQFPVAELRFHDDRFPGRVNLTAFNPFIPLNEDESGLPAAFFEFALSNPTSEAINYTLCATLGTGHVLAGSDYPQPEGLANPAEFADELASLSDSDRRLILRDNFRKCSGLETGTDLRI